MDRAIASDAIGSRFESYLRHQIDGETRTFRDNSKTTWKKVVSMLLWIYQGNLYKIKKEEHLGSKWMSPLNVIWNWHSISAD